MGNLLSTAKQILIDQANVLYEVRRSGLDRDALSYRSHYSNLAEIIFQIDSYESFGDIIKDIENDNLQELGYWGADDAMLEEFLTDLLKNK